MCTLTGTHTHTHTHTNEHGQPHAHARAHTHTHTEPRELSRAQRQFPSRSSRGSSSTIVPTGSRPRALDGSVCLGRFVSMCMHVHV